MNPEAFNQHEALTQARVAIAIHNAKITELSKDMTELKEAFDAQALMLQQVLNTLAEARGGWRTLMMLGGLSATFGGIIAWLVEHFMKRGG